MATKKLKIEKEMPSLSQIVEIIKLIDLVVEDEQIPASIKKFFIDNQ